MRCAIARIAVPLAVYLSLCGFGCHKESHLLAGKWRADISDGLFNQFKHPTYTFEAEGKFLITAESVMLPGATLQIKGTYKVEDDALTLRANFFGMKMQDPKAQPEANESLKKLSAEAFAPMNEDSTDMKLNWTSEKSVSFANARGATTTLTKIGEEPHER